MLKITSLCGFLTKKCKKLREITKNHDFLQKLQLYSYQNRDFFCENCIRTLFCEKSQYGVLAFSTLAKIIYRTCLSATTTATTSTDSDHMASIL